MKMEGKDVTFWNGLCLESEREREGKKLGLKQF